MKYTIQKPSPELSAYIKQYWALDNNKDLEVPYFQRIVPNGFVELIFFFNGLPEYFKQNSSVSSTSLLTGQQSEFYNIKIEKAYQLFSIMFNPVGARRFLDIPLNKIDNLTIPAIEVLGSRIQELEEKLFEKELVEDKVKIIEQYLLKKLAGERCYQITRIEDSISRINRFHGQIDISDLADCACLSRKQYERQFADYIGLSPKQFLKVVRFQYAIYKRQLIPGTTLTSLAVDCGYYDQAHMNSEFRHLSGLTPGQYFKNCEPYSDYFSSAIC